MRRITALRWTKLGLFTCVLVPLLYMLYFNYNAHHNQQHEVRPTTNNKSHEVSISTIHKNKPHYGQTNGKHDNHSLKNSRIAKSIDYNYKQIIIEKRQINTFMNISLIFDKKHQLKCKKYLVDLGRRWSVVRSLFPTEVDCEDCITYATHFASNRMDMFLQLLHYWSGPISVAIMIEEAMVGSILEKIKNVMKRLDRSNINATIVYQDGTYYPSNLMRNIALEQVMTSYVFIGDIDFMPMKDSEIILHSHTHNLTDKMVYVAPAFEFTKENVDMSVLKNKQNVIEAIKNKNSGLQTFHPSFEMGHHATDYDKWYTASTPYKIEYERGYEPYVLIRKSALQRFAEMFIGRGWNKAQWFYLLHKLNYMTYIMPDVYLVHLYHSKTHISARTSTGQSCSDIVWRHWKKMVDLNAAFSREFP